MTAPVFTNGFGGSVLFDSYELFVVEWSLKAENGLIDVTNVGSSNWGQFISGINNGTVSMKAFWDTTLGQIYTGSTANLKPGQTGVGTLKIGNTGRTIVVSIIIMSVSLTNSPAAGVTYDIEAKVTGSPTYPS